MTDDQQQAQQEHENYWQAVTDVAERVVDDYEADEDADDELLTRLINEKCDQHDYVIGNELCIHTLKYSDNACAGFFDGTFAANQYGRTDDFPFTDLAADAFEADVTAKVGELLGEVA